MRLNIYTDNDKYLMHMMEYKAVWKSEGKKIQDAFLKILGVPFSEKKINLLINEGAKSGNDSGANLNDKMHFRYNNRCKIGTFLHELGHRIILEYDMLNKAIELYHVNNIHQVLDLFLYDVIVEAYGKDAALLRVEYESNFPEEEYKDSWVEVLNLSFDERQERIRKILEVE